MSELPSFLAPSQAAAKLPSFLAPAAVPAPAFVAQVKQETKELVFDKFKLAFPRVIDRMYGGETLNKILENFPHAIERGAFMRWIKKDAERFAVYTEAKETRTEIWTGEIIKIALGEDDVMDLDRAKFLVDTYKFLIKAENRKGYGDSKQLEVVGNISITAALQAAETRAKQITEFKDDDEPEPTFKQLSEAVIEADYEEVESDD